MRRHKEPEQRISPTWSILSVACPICVIAMALLIKAGGHHGGGNLEIFPKELALVIPLYLGFSVAGIVCGVVGLAKWRWPIIALLGLSLNGFLLLSLFIH